jgi:ionotropic kainate glutamate receptor 4
MLISSSVYTANLTAALTLNKLGVPLESVLDLLDQDKYSWGIVGNTGPEILLKYHKDARYTQLVEKGLLLKSVEEGFKNVRTGDFVFIDEWPILQYYKSGDCDLVNVGPQFQSFEYSFGLPNDSPYKPLIDAYLLRLRENGVVDSLWKKWSSGPTSCSKKKVGTADKITLNLGLLSGLFILLCVLVGFSLIASLIEFVFAIVWDTKQIKGLSMMMALRRRVSFVLEDLLNMKKFSQKTEEVGKEKMDKKIEDSKFCENMEGTEKRNLAMMSASI